MYTQTRNNYKTNMSSGIVVLLLLLVISISDAIIVICDFPNFGGCFTESRQRIYCNRIRPDKVTFLEVGKTYDLTGIPTAKFRNFGFFNVFQKFEMSPSFIKLSGLFSFPNGPNKSTGSSLRSITSRMNNDQKGIQLPSISPRSWCALGRQANIIEEFRGGICLHCKSCRRK